MQNIKDHSVLIAWKTDTHGFEQVVAIAASSPQAALLDIMKQYDNGARFDFLAYIGDHTPQQTPVPCSRAQRLWRTGPVFAFVTILACHKNAYAIATAATDAHAQVRLIGAYGLDARRVHEIDFWCVQSIDLPLLPVPFLTPLSPRQEDFCLAYGPCLTKRHDWACNPEMLARYMQDVRLQMSIPSRLAYGNVMQDVWTWERMPFAGIPQKFSDDAPAMRSAWRCIGNTGRPTRADLMML